jgi:hypothetical protein
MDVNQHLAGRQLRYLPIDDLAAEAAILLLFDQQSFECFHGCSPAREHLTRG